MSTMMIPAADDTPLPEPAYTGAGLRFVAIHANLLPDEVVATRRLRRTKLRMAIGFGGLVVLLLAWFGFTVFQTHTAHNDLNAAQNKSVALQNTLHKYAPLVDAQTQSAAIQQSLARLMAGDLQWSDLMTALQGPAGSGVGITRVEGTLDSATSGPAQKGGLTVLNTSGAREVGTLTVSGFAADKNAVAAYVDSLTKVKGLAAPFPASLLTQPGQVTFSVDVIITADALGGRYGTKTPAPVVVGSQGGK